MKVSVLGAAGGIGQPLALLLKNSLPAGSQLALYDVNPMVPGVAADLSHIPTPAQVSGHSCRCASQARYVTGRSVQCQCRYCQEVD